MNMNVDLNKKPKELGLVDFIVLCSIYSSTNNVLKINKFIKYFKGVSLDLLLSLNYIKYNTDSISLRKQGLSVFEVEEDPYFAEFIKIFPTRVPTTVGGSRHVSPRSLQSKEASDLRKKWANITKDNNNLKQEIIDKLKFDLQTRVKESSLFYLRNAETYLNNRDYEQIELPSENSNKETFNTGERTI